MPRLAGVGLALLMLATACQADQGTVELQNKSDHHLLWMPTSMELLDDALRNNDRWVTTRPGGRVVKQSSPGANKPGWCDDATLSHFLLATRDGQALDGSSPDARVNVSLDDFEIVASRGPGHCWGERDATWVFSGS